MAQYLNAVHRLQQGAYDYAKAKGDYVGRNGRRGFVAFEKHWDEKGNEEYQHNAVGGSVGEPLGESAGVAPNFKVGDTYDGRRFLGGDPNDIKSWEDNAMSDWKAPWEVDPMKPEPQWSPPWQDSAPANEDIPFGSDLVGTYARSH